MDFCITTSVWIRWIKKDTHKRGYLYYKYLYTRRRKVYKREKMKSRAPIYPLSVQRNSFFLTHFCVAMKNRIGLFSDKVKSKREENHQIREMNILCVIRCSSSIVHRIQRDALCIPRTCIAYYVHVSLLYVFPKSFFFYYVRHLNYL